ncbi:GDSL esterase/lipase 5-like [Syzygium oleosum]|uniref:GDSL esterase/lipase 5-like n=1 Tax=Syzygium oleosum TaxID=219896 RepID=UPI0011D2BACC|nr:GDSL esterase/lipase 5-like [Syzygium oleosum]
MASSIHLKAHQISLLLLSLSVLAASDELEATASPAGLRPEAADAAAFFVFGDSTVDPGNNNYIKTIPENRADYEPYGQDGSSGRPTGRFSNGRVIVDFIAEHANLPAIPPFMQPSADYSRGVNFASGGGGVLQETNQGQAIDLPTQLKNFDQVRGKLIETLGEARAQAVVSEAVYFISIGSNDYMGGYLGNPAMRQLHPSDLFIGMVIGNLTNVIQELYQRGGRKFGFLSLGPLGCLPALRAANPNSNAGDGGCFEDASALAQGHNTAVNGILLSLQHIFKGFKYANSNFYEWLADRMSNPSNYGFKDGVNACCGSGPYGGVFTCGGKQEAEYKLCENPEDHVWWDSFHPTEKIHKQFAKALWDGLVSVVGPYNLRDLFFDKDKATIADLVDGTVEQDFMY